MSKHSASSLACPPRFRIAEIEGNDGWGDLAVDFSNTYVAKSGEALYDWQEDVIYCWFQTDDYDETSGYYNTYSYTTCGLIVPRQNGKTKWIAVPRMLVGAIFKGEKIRYSAQRVDTMLETFGVCVEIVGNPDDPKEKGRNPELYEFCQPKISFVNGHQKITFKSGGVISFVSRSRDAGRGNTADINIFDEAQTLTDQQLADSLPNNAAAQSGNPQTIFLGTPPQPERESGEAFSRIRTTALNKAVGHCWHEWSVDDVGDVKDKDRWYATNPSLGKSLLVKKVADDLTKMTPLVFAIEHMCFWTQAAKPEMLDADVWDASITEDVPAADDIAKKAVGVKFAPSGQVCASVAILKKDGSVVGELISEEYVPQMTSTAGLNELINWLVSRREQIALIAIDGKTGAGELYDRLLNTKAPNGKKAFLKKFLHVMKTSEVPTAATYVTNGLAEKTLTHFADDILDASAHVAEKRKIGNDGLGFGGDSCPIESFAAAVWAVRTTKNDPTRKTRWVK